MINMYVSLKELNRLYQKMGAKADAKQTSLFRVRTGLKCGSDWADEGLRECRDFCTSKGYSNQPDFECECECL